MAGIRLSRRKFVALAGAAVAGAPFVSLEEPTTVEHYIDHIDHIAKLVGIEYAGVGTDADLA